MEPVRSVPTLAAANAGAQVLPPAAATEQETAPAETAPTAESSPAPAPSKEGPAVEPRIGDGCSGRRAKPASRVGLDTPLDGRNPRHRSARVVRLHVRLGLRRRPTRAGRHGGGALPLRRLRALEPRHYEHRGWVSIPIRFVEPSFTFGAGYAKLGDFDFRNADELERAGVDIDGVDLRAGVGLDVYLPFKIYVGTEFTGDLLIFARPAVSTRRFSNALDATAAQIYSQDGSSIGGGTSLTGVVGVHLF